MIDITGVGRVGRDGWKFQKLYEFIHVALLVFLYIGIQTGHAKFTPGIDVNRNGSRIIAARQSYGKRG